MSYKDWIRELAYSIDYYGAFLKDWIAFNAWYNEEYPMLSTDAAIIAQMQNDSNNFKAHLKNLLVSQEPTGQEFRATIGNLHSALLSANIRTKERTGVEYQISFSEIAIAVKDNQFKQTYRKTKYSVERQKSKVITQIFDLSGNELLNCEQEKYDFKSLETFPSFQALSPERQGQCKALYMNAIPYNLKSLLVQVDKDKTDQYTSMGDFQFVPDIDDICKGIIEVLYSIRNALVHGAITPNLSNQKVYQYSHEILVTMLNKLL